jgi:hypothetical protein
MGLVAPREGTAVEARHQGLAVLVELRRDGLLAADDADDSTDPRVVGDGGDPGAAALAGAWAVASGEAGFTGDCYELELTRAQGGGLPAGKRLFYKCVGIRWHVMVCGVTGKPQQQQAMV